MEETLTTCSADVYLVAAVYCLPMLLLIFGVFKTRKRF